MTRQRLTLFTLLVVATVGLMLGLFAVAAVTIALGLLE